MPEWIIKAEGLGKRYKIRHQLQRRHYVALRDVLSERVKGLFRPASSAADTVEQFWATRDLSFEIMRGEVVGIVGRNGAGKSTLLKLLSRITEPSEGRIRLRGRVASLLEVGTGFHPELTGRENIFLNGAIMGMSRQEIRGKFDAIVDFAEIEKFLDTPVKRYSSGMYVRLAFSVAAHLEPDILIVDEVLAVGDAVFQKKCLGKMQDVSSGGRTVLFVSHNMSAVRVLCTSGLLLSEGRMKFYGSAERCIREYESGAAGGDSGSWRRPAESPVGILAFGCLTVRVVGEQPNLQLVATVELVGESRVQQVIMALDIMDTLGVSIMQSLPRVEPFPASGAEHRKFEIVVDLPPLVPGRYSVSAWVGPHNTESFDYIHEAVNFTVLTSPSPGRTFPHTADHGYVVPHSTLSPLA